MHHTMFEFLKPTDAQIAQMQSFREEFAALASFIDTDLEDGPDKAHIIRELRTIAMWCNVAITRNPDGSPRT